MQLMRLLAER